LGGDRPVSTYFSRVWSSWKLTKLSLDATEEIREKHDVFLHAMHCSFRQCVHLRQNASPVPFNYCTKFIQRYRGKAAVLYILFYEFNDECHSISVDACRDGIRPLSGSHVAVEGGHDLHNAESKNIYFYNISMWCQLWSCSIGNLMARKVQILVVPVPLCRTLTISLTIFNIGIILSVYKSKRNKALNKSTVSQDDSSIFLATILVTSAFIVFQLPDKICDLFWSNWKGDVTKTVQEWQRLTIHLTALTENMNYCLNSYIYVLACGRLRKEMFAVVYSRIRANQ
jgi:hypothetical protein